MASAAVARVLITAPDRLARVLITAPDRLQMRGAVAEYERTLIVERRRRGRLAKLRAGTLLPWTRVPYGLSVTLDRPRDPAGGRIDPVAGAHLHELFRGYLEARATVGLLVATRERQGIPTPHGGRHWNRSTVRWLLSNPVSRGHV